MFAVGSFWKPRRIVNVLVKAQSKAVAMKIAPFIVPLFVLVGCASAPSPSPRAEAASHVKPIISALRAYHRDAGDYPRQLDDLRPRYLRADIPLYDYSDQEHIWLCSYIRVDQNDYSLQFYTEPCSQAIYNNGKFVEADGPAFSVLRSSTSPSPPPQSRTIWQ